ncbi:inter-alpha-trypsin inhibitor heavy chain H3-like isoform X2 [Anoplophora glabripennis]|uniref:inter-alpha-trypsin inhibitor heavy chain H3-like isoform X2 n=1 Tax=Anoplophora glabripennis TaxID=217634 RepID=UPI000875615B|nr:inter-alpha-trypsin inhibitor heavy chain H3-like isoform X2 [Anoplophora glabripennis]
MRSDEVSGSSMFFNVLIFLIIWNVKVTHQDVNQTLDLPVIREFIVKTFVANHFAKTTVLSEVENDDTYPKQTTFSVVFPEGAFISDFSIKVGGKIYNALVKSAEEIGKTYDQPVESNQSAGYVAARNSNRFTINVDIEPKSKVNFNLTYEELLQREKGQYEIITNIQPGQIVMKLAVEVEIQENRPLLFVRTPHLRSGNNALTQDNSQLDTYATVKVSNTSATITFEPDLQRQLQFVCAGLGSREYEGFAGQFVVQYDIERDDQGGEEIEIPDAILATSENIDIAKRIINSFNADGGTNTIGALEVGLYLVRLVQEKHQGVYQPILIFLTDGLPSVGVENSSEIISMVLDINSKEYNTPIYSLCFGVNADWNFLQELSLVTKAKATRIYVNDDGTESDVSIQLKMFYESINEPLLSDIMFDNLPPSVQMTQLSFPIFIKGSEITIAGKGPIEDNTKPIKISATGQEGSVDLDAKIRKPLIQLERIWAHLTIKQLIQQSYLTSLQSNQAEFKKIALELALQYNLVTNVTSLIVVKPNEILTSNIKDASHGIFTESPNDLPMCNNIPNWVALRFGTPEPIYMKVATEMTTDVITTNDDTIAATIHAVATTTPDTITTSTTDDTIAATILAVATTTPDTIITSTTDITTTSTTDDVTTTSTTDDYTTTTTDVTSTYSTDTVSSTDTIILTTEQNIPVAKANIITNRQPTELTPLIEEVPIIYRITKTCRDMRFGCCHDGVTPAVGINFSGCDPIPRSESCSLPLSPGKPLKNVRREWAYSVKEGECRTFWYYGSGGNDNRFVNQSDCQRTCINVIGPDRCKLPLFTGPSQKACTTTPKVRWFYDQNKDKCISNTYFGCFGNSNRFSTERECLELCSSSFKRTQLQRNKKTCEVTKFGCCHDRVTPARGSNYSGCDPIPRPESCSLKADRGIPCSHSSLNYSTPTKWAYVMSVGECRQLHYFGCGGNDNRFAYKKDCELVCVEATGFDRCKLPIFLKSTKPLCSVAPTQRWFYDQKQNDCVQHEYSGCFGNTNRFLTKKECEECITPTNEAMLHESCLLKIEMGTCTNYTSKWAFNKTEGRCTHLWYGGCGGNANAFDSVESCKRVCVNPSEIDPR